MTQSATLRYFLAGKRNHVLLETIEISHPAFSQVFRRVRNARDGLTATLETGETVVFGWYPLQITALADAADLDTGFRIDFGDLGEIIPVELDRVKQADTMAVKPTIIYRAYRSDDLTAPLIGPLRLEATTFSFKREGASFEASAPYVNLNRTGETYNLTRFPMLRGFVK